MSPTDDDDPTEFLTDLATATHCSFKANDGGDVGNVEVDLYTYAMRDFTDTGCSSCQNPGADYYLVQDNVTYSMSASGVTFLIQSDAPFEASSGLPLQAGVARSRVCRSANGDHLRVLVQQHLGRDGEWIGRLRCRRPQRHCGRPGDHEQADHILRARNHDLEQIGSGDCGGEVGVHAAVCRAPISQVAPTWTWYSYPGTLIQRRYR